MFGSFMVRTLRCAVLAIQVQCCELHGKLHCLVGLKKGKFQPQFLKSLNWKSVTDPSPVGSTADTYQSTGETRKDDATLGLGALQPLEIKFPGL